MTAVDAYFCSKNLKKCVILIISDDIIINITLKFNTNATFFLRTLVKDLKIVFYLSLKPTHITFGIFIGPKKDTVLFSVFFFLHNLKFKYMVN